MCGLPVRVGGGGRGFAVARRLPVGMVANGAMVAVWAVSRTTGLPVGPDPWMPEALGALDLLATGLEIVLIAVGAWALSATSPTEA